MMKTTMTTTMVIFQQRRPFHTHADDGARVRSLTSLGPPMVNTTTTTRTSAPRQQQYHHLASQEVVQERHHHRRRRMNDNDNADDGGFEQREEEEIDRTLRAAVLNIATRATLGDAPAAIAAMVTASETLTLQHIATGGGFGTDNGMGGGGGGGDINWALARVHHARNALGLEPRRFSESLDNGRSGEAATANNNTYNEATPTIPVHRKMLTTGSGGGGMEGKMSKSTDDESWPNTAQALADIGYSSRGTPCDVVIVHRWVFFFFTVHR